MSAIEWALVVIVVGVLLAWFVGRVPRLLILHIDNIGMRYLVLKVTYFVSGILILYEVAAFLLKYLKG